MSKLKRIECHITSFEIDFRRFEHKQKSDQLSITLTPSMEGIFETTGTADIDINPSHSMIEPILNRKFGNTFYHQNGQNKHQHTNKHFS